MEMQTWMVVTGIASLMVALSPVWLGLRVIGSEQIGIVTKKFSSRRLGSGQYVALNGEAGLQADALSPGWHLGYFPWQYKVEKASLTVIPKNTVGLVVAKTGSSIPSSRVLGKHVECEAFQNARQFLSNGGEKGRQLGILTAGVYRINTAVFEIIRDIPVVVIEADQVGIITTFDGATIEGGEIAGRTVDGHEGFQNAQKFMELGGQKGLQEQVLMAGSWNLNPWFAHVEIDSVTEIPLGSVGVVISYVGKEHKDVSGESFQHGDLVETGHKGVWEKPLYPGKHPLNTVTTKVERVPTTNIALNWANNRSESHKLDERLSSITVRSQDGFSFNLDVTQIIHVGAKEASRVISRFGSMKQLVDEVLEPQIGNYFRNSAQGHTVLDFLAARSDRQSEALALIKKKLLEYDIQAVDTYIGDIVAPVELMKTQTDRKMAEESRKTYIVQEEAQKQRQSFAKEEALAKIQETIVGNEQNVRVQEFKAAAAVKEAEGAAKSITIRAEAQAEATRKTAFAEATRIEQVGKAEATSIEAIGMAKAKGYEAGVRAMGPETYGKLQIMNVIGDKGVKITPEFLVTGGGTEGSGTNGMMMSALMADLLKDKLKSEKDDSRPAAKPA